MLFVRNSNSTKTTPNSIVRPQFFTGDCKTGGGN